MVVLGLVAADRLFSSGGRRLPFIAMKQWLLVADGAQAPGPQAPVVQHAGFSCPQHVQSFYTRDQTRVSCFGRHIPIHCTPQGVLYNMLLARCPAVLWGCASNPQNSRCVLVVSCWKADTTDRAVLAITVIKTTRVKFDKEKINQQNPKCGTPTRERK